MRANQFITEAQDSDAVNELDLFIMNDEDLYRQQFMPKILNLRKRFEPLKGAPKKPNKTYDHQKAIKLWMYLVDDAARKYVQDNGSPAQDVKDMFPKETRLKVAQVIADREKENIENGEYDDVKGRPTPAIGDRSIGR